MATSPWYREGTAKFTQGSTTVTGTGTRWVDFVRAGDGIQGPDGKLYQVTNVASNTSMSITPAYGSETTYWTIPIQGYVKRLADAASQLVRDFEGGADEALDAADRARQSATEAKASENAALSQANRAEAEADRAETEADRAQQAADDAVAVVTDGGGSIDPEAGKWPVAGAEGTIKKAWVHELEFALDKLRVATNKALYGDGPYPVLDFQFQGANMLDPRIEFTRASKDWDWDGREYGIDEPVLTDEGLWVSGARTNFCLNSVVAGSFSDVAGATKSTIYSEHLERNAVSLIEDESNQLHRMRWNLRFLASPSTRYTLSFLAKSVGRDVRLDGTGFGRFDFRLSQGVVAHSVPNGAAGITERNDGWFFCWVSIDSPDDMTSFYCDFRLLTGDDIVYQGDGESGILVSSVQFEEGYAPTPFIPTEDSQVTVAATIPFLSNPLPKTGLSFTASVRRVGRSNFDGAVLKIGPNRTAFEGLQVRLGDSPTNKQAQCIFREQGSSPKYIIQSSGESDVSLAASWGSDMAFSLGGGVSTLGEVIDLSPLNLSYIYIGCGAVHESSSGSRFLSGFVKRMSFYDFEMTAQQLQELTS